MNIKWTKFITVLVLAIGFMAGCSSTPQSSVGQPASIPSANTSATAIVPLPSPSPLAQNSMPTASASTPTASSNSGTVTGTLFYNEIKPFAQVPVVLYKQPRQQGDSPVFTTTTDSQGGFLFTDIPFGEYATAFDFQPLQAQGYDNVFPLGQPLLTIAPTSTVANSEYAVVYRVHLLKPFDNKDFATNYWMQYPTAERSLTIQWNSLPDAKKRSLSIWDAESRKQIVSEQDFALTEFKMTTEVGHSYSVTIVEYHGDSFPGMPIGIYSFQIIGQ